MYQIIQESTPTEVVTNSLEITIIQNKRLPQLKNYFFKNVWFNNPDISLESLFFIRGKWYYLTKITMYEKMKQTQISSYKVLSFTINWLLIIWK